MLVISLVFYALHVLVYWVAGLAEWGDTMRHLLNLFNMNREVSIPTWWNQVLLAVAALLAVCIGRDTRVRRGTASDSGYWIALAVFMGLASLDEGSAVHEIASAPFRVLLGVTTGPLSYAWIVPALAVVLVLVLVFLRFFLRLPVRTRWGLALAFAVYLFGAVGLEAVAANFLTGGGEVTGIPYIVLSGGEEFLEMLGAIVFIDTLLDYAKRQSRSLVEVDPLGA
jgi:hypothetical protein